MLRALLTDLAELPSVSVCVMLDPLCRNIADEFEVEIYTVQESRALTEQFAGCLADVDAVWPIAPEFDDILETYSRLVEQAGKRLLNSSAEAVALTANKWRTYEVLHSAPVATPFTQRLCSDTIFCPGTWVIKPIDGVGCSNTYKIANALEFEQTLALLDAPERFLLQPYLEGDNQSLSVFFERGRGLLLCVNRQIIYQSERQFKLLACEVNALSISPAYEQLIFSIAKAIPGLSGYVGIDLIVDNDKIFVLEINPRLTSSYAGLREALGINCAEWVLGLANPACEFKASRNEVVQVFI